MPCASPSSNCPVYDDLSETMNKCSEAMRAKKEKELGKGRHVVLKKQGKTTQSETMNKCSEAMKTKKG